MSDDDGQKRKEGCFKNRTKHRCAKFVFVVSIMLIFIGLGAGIFGYFGLDIKETWTLGDQTYPSPVALFGILAIIAGLFSFLTGILGLCAAKYKKCCFTMPFMIFSIIMALVMLIVAVLGLAGQNKEVVRLNFCTGAIKMPGGATYDSLETYAEQIYGSAVNKWMCTPTCPCDQAQSAKWLAPEVKAKFTLSSKRVQSYDDLTDEQKRDVNGNNGIDSLVPWQMNLDIPFPLYFKPVNPTVSNLNLKDGVFDNFQSCYDQNLKTAWAASGSAQSEFVTTGMPFFNKIEKDLDCSSACYLPLFGVSRPLSKGPVERQCVDVIIDSLDSLTAPGVVCLLTFFVLICACCGSIPLCSGFTEDEGRLEEG